MTYVDVPPKAAMLYALEVPSREAGGNTYFANMFAAYEIVPGDLKYVAADKIAVRDASTNSCGHAAQGYKEVTDARQMVGAIIPWSAPSRGPGVRRYSLAAAAPMS
jgi:taurine dioxygenase